MTMRGNIWTAFKFDTPITVNANSTITFSYYSDNLPEIAAIGFVNNTNKDGNPVFNYDMDSLNAVKIAGTQGNNWPEEVFSPLYSYTPGTSSLSGVATYTLSLASFLTIGDTFSFITFINDDDGVVGPDKDKDGMSVFSNVSLSNTSPTPLPAAALLLGTGLLGLVGIRRRNA